MPDHIIKKDIQDYIDHHHSKNYDTLSNISNSILFYYNTIKKNNWTKIKCGSQPIKVWDVVTYEELEKMAKGIPNKEERLMIESLYELGCRQK